MGRKQKQFAVMSAIYAAALAYEIWNGNAAAFAAGSIGGVFWVAYLLRSIEA